MNHTEDNTRSIEVAMPTRLTEDTVATLLSTASSATCGFAWWKEENRDDYEEARRQLVSEGNAEPTADDIWSRMLFNGKALLLLDPESDWHWKGFPEGERLILFSWEIALSGSEPEGGDWKRVTLDDIVKGFGKYLAEKPASGLDSIDRIVEDGDFWDADCVMQYAAYGEVIYG